MRYVEAPTYASLASDEVSVFLAGGITGCPDWQAQVREALSDTDLTVLNPRRADFDVTRGDSAAQQVEWEFEHLHQATVTMFWFPACDPTVTVQPIAMFELGAASASSFRRIVVGADLGYPRRLDVQLQLSHVRPWLGVNDSLADVLEVMRTVDWKNA